MPEITLLATIHCCCCMILFTRTQWYTYINYQLLYILTSLNKISHWTYTLYPYRQISALRSQLGEARDLCVDLESASSERKEADTRSVTCRASLFTVLYCVCNCWCLEWSVQLQHFMTRYHMMRYNVTWPDVSWHSNLRCNIIWYATQCITRDNPSSHPTGIHSVQSD